ncbi:hypothetical protein FSP39_023939 [Pinctada imbricata]|uniref:Dystonin n=1 Tax=Pinctada imbricata TaxID=66713 RepID=A0AA88Y1C7_PINIB|nr:hypothetical protein FSP39_023939 [Pinctada imbricata]
MGGTVSHCSGKHGKKKRNKKKLSDDINNHNGSVDGLRTKASRLIPKISQHDKDLVEDRIRASERKYGEIQTRADKAHKQQDALSGTLDDIKAEVDKYLAWLTDREKTMAEDIPLGYSVKDAETRLKEHNAICRELEVKQATVDIVKEKVKGLIDDLPREEREAVDKWLSDLSERHHDVYRQAEDKRKLLAASVSQREQFQAALEKIYQWLQGKEREGEKLHTLRLAAGDVEKQLDKCKALQQEVANCRPQIEDIIKRGQMLHVDCTPQEKAEVDHKITDVQTRYDSLSSGLSDHNNHLRDCIAARKVFESDLQKNDKWCKETEIKCSTEPCLDCAVEVLEEQLRQYKPTHQNSNNNSGPLPEKYERVDALIKQRIAALEGALSCRSQVAENISEAKALLTNAQEDIRNISRSLGPEIVDAENALQQYESVGEKLSTYHPAITQLNQAVERLRGSGQNTEADEILRLTSQFELLQDQVDQQSKKCQQGLLLRQQYQDQRAELETLLRDCEDEINSVSELGLTIPVRIEKLEALSHKLQEASPVTENLSRSAQLLCMDSSSEDAKTVAEKIQDLQAYLNQLKKTCERKTKQCETIQRNREEFETSIDDAISWLEQKEEILAHRGAQDLDVVQVEMALQKHNILAKEALEKLEILKDKAQLVRAHYEKLEEPLPASLAEKLDQIQTLEDSIKDAINKKEEYLLEAKTDRMQLENSMKQVNDWLSGAEDMMQESGYETLDYDTLNETLSELKDYFDEASMCQDEMDQVMELSERLMPTLDPNDKETLRQMLNNANQRLSNVVTNSNRKQQLMEHKAAEWKDYQMTVYQVAEQLQALDEQWAQIEHVPVTNQEALSKQLADTKNFQAKVEDLRPAILEVNDKSRDLERFGNDTSRALIEKLAGNINEKMTELASTSENKQLALQDVGNQWEEYATLVEGVESMLAQVDESMPLVELEKASTHELATQLADTRQLCGTLEVSEPKITSMKKCAQALLRNLPTAEAKVHTQEKLMTVLEKLERTQEKAKEQHAALQEELEDRDMFNKEMNQITTTLASAKDKLVNLGPGKEVTDVMEKIEKQKVLEQEVAIQMEQVKHLSQQQASKYNAHSKSVPQELQLQLATVQEQASEVSELMKGKEEELRNIKVDREELTEALRGLQSWLGNADTRLQERVVNIPDSQLRHKKQRVQRLISDTNRQWLALQAKSADKSNRLNEAEELQAKFKETADALSRWASSAEATIATDPERTDFAKIKEQLRQHRRLAKDVDQQQGKVSHLNELLKRLDQSVDAGQARDKLAKLNSRMFKIQSDVSSRLNTLEETNDQIEDYEHELRDLRKWMDDTRANLTMKESAVNLNDQLAFHEKLLEDIENRKGKALLVAEKQTELQKTGKPTSKPQPASKLAAEITELQQLARDQCETLRQAVAQQEQYEREIKELTGAISEAQEKLLTSPVEASDVGSLKKQIEEHNDLARKIKSYQARVNDLNEKSRDLSRKTAKLGPAMSDKLADLGFYPASLSSLRLPAHPDSDKSAADSGVYASPRSSLNTTQQTISDDIITPSTFHSTRASNPQKWQSSPSVSGLSPRSMKSAKSTDTTHGLSASDIFDQSRPLSSSRDMNINLNWSHPSGRLSGSLRRPDDTDGSETAGSLPSFRFTPQLQEQVPLTHLTGRREAPP